MEHVRDVVVVGAGAAGLVAAAELGRRGVDDVLVLERGEGVGASWRSRYEGLRLNTIRQFSRVRGLRIRRAMGRYLSREAFIAYLEDYARHSGIDVRCEVTAQRVDRAGDDHWRVATNADELTVRHVVIAAGWGPPPGMAGGPRRGSLPPGGDAPPPRRTPPHP